MIRYILITGASRGLGFEIAKELSDVGYGIILVSNNKKNLEIAKKNLNHKMRHIVIKTNLKKKNSIKIILKKIQDIAIESIIHNFGVKLEKDEHEIDIDILQKSINANFIRSIELNQALSDRLEGNPSKIIHIGSTASIHAKASPSYTLSKSLINVYVKNISKHYIDKNILICSVLPGIMAHKDSDWDKKKLSEPVKYIDTQKRQPLQRFLTPNEIAKNISLLVQSKNLVLTGSIIKMDANEY